MSRLVPIQCQAILLSAASTLYKRSSCPLINAASYIYKPKDSSCLSSLFKFEFSYSIFISIKVLHWSLLHHCLFT
ncbi:hypothetical protein FB192DRAFT_1439626, partial [Mucor lusitanicus]